MKKPPRARDRNRRSRRRPPTPSTTPSAPRAVDLPPAVTTTTAAAPITAARRRAAPPRATRGALADSVPALVGPHGLAKFLGVSLATIKRNVRSKKIPTLRIGRQLRFDLLAVKKALEPK